MPGPFVIKYKLVDTTLPSQRDAQEETLEDGLDMTVPGLARFAGANPPAALTAKLGGDCRSRARAPKAAFRARGAERRACRTSRAACAPRASCAGWLASPGAPLDKDAAFEIDFRLAQTERKFERALVTAQGLRIEALADDGIVVPGQKVKLTLIVANRGGCAGRRSRSTRVPGFADDAVRVQSGPARAG